MVAVLLLPRWSSIVRAELVVVVVYVCVSAKRKMEVSGKSAVSVNDKKTI